MAEIKFRRDTAFRKQFFVPDSFAHPAKMDAQLLIWIVEKYTKEGETILDPMGGSGTLMLACGLGRNVVLVELEEKFCQMMRDNWERVRMHPQLGSTMGECQIIQGDARQLEGLVDGVITSPPYTNRMDGGMRGSRAGMVPYTEEAPDSWYTQRDQRNIGNLSYGQIDSIISSPPYENGASGPSRSPFWDRLANDPTSARYGRKKHPSVGQGYSVDSIITSPPYENQVHGGTTLKPISHTPSEVGNLMPDGYSHSTTNIGNLKSDSYLQAMLQVYQQCFKVLKDGGLLVLITKDFIRNKQRIDLAGDTIKLCEQAGFSFVERHYRKLPAQSFWRVIYRQKYPDAPEIDHEDVLVFTR